MIESYHRQALGINETQKGEIWNHFFVKQSKRNSKLSYFSLLKRFILRL